MTLNIGTVIRATDPPSQVEQSRSIGFGQTAVGRTWHVQDSQGQILAVISAVNVQNDSNSTLDLRLVYRATLESS